MYFLKKVNFQMCIRNKTSALNREKENKIHCSVFIWKPSIASHVGLLSLPTCPEQGCHSSQPSNGISCSFLSALW